MCLRTQRFFHCFFCNETRNSCSNYLDGSNFSVSLLHRASAIDSEAPNLRLKMVIFSSILYFFGVVKVSRLRKASKASLSRRERKCSIFFKTVMCWYILMLFRKRSSSISNFSLSAGLDLAALEPSLLFGMTAFLFWLLVNINSLRIFGRFRKRSYGRFLERTKVIKMIKRVKLRIRFKISQVYSTSNSHE